jgi:hypothetical protein
LSRCMRCSTRLVAQSTGANTVTPLMCVSIQRKRIHVARSRHIIPLDQADAPALWNFISGGSPLVRFSRRALSRLFHPSLAYAATVSQVFSASRPFYHPSAALFASPKLL